MLSLQHLHCSRLNILGKHVARLYHPHCVFVCVSLSLSREREREVEGTPAERLSWNLFYQYHHLFCKLKTKKN